ncbi:MAG: efflux RND transporter permease subunit [Bryobacterales bacterium]|nr:efflux RND transporter permease subunit [Bryobacterales bacterium]
MNFTAFFIRRAVTTTLLMAALLIFGILGYVTLPVSDLPPVEYPTLQVRASLPGANPDTMASTVATPLERAFLTIAGLESMSSTSSLGNTNITLQFSLDRDIDAAAQDVQSALSQASRSLPADMPTPPSYNKVNPADQPVVYMGLWSETLPPYVVDDYAQNLLAQRISSLSGVAQVNVFGSQKYAVRVQVDPEKLASRGIGLNEIREALARSNVNLPAGALYGTSRAYTVQANSQLSSAAQFRPLIVAYRNGSPVRLEQVARVTDGVQNEKTAFWIKDKRGMTLAVQKQPGVNTVQVVDRIKAVLPSLRQQMPAGLNLIINSDRSQSIRESIADVKFTLWLTIGLVIFVIFVFLRNVSATMIPSVAVPLSLVGTFGAMYMLNYSVDNLSLMAMTLSVGFVVDDAIVMLENIVRHREMGKERLQAAYEGAKEISFTIVSMTISLVAVFIPVLFLGGIVGRLLREFSVTIAVAVLISGVISLTFTPLLCSRFLGHQESHKQGLFFRITEAGFAGLLGFYDRTLKFTLRHRLATLMLNLVLAGYTFYLFGVIPKGFLPPEDIGTIFGQTEASEDSSFEKMVGLQQQVRDVLLAHPAVQTTVTGVGGNFGGQNTGFVFAQLKDRHERVPAQQVINEVRTQMAKIPGINAFMRIPPLITIGGQQGRALYQVSLQDVDTQTLYSFAPKFEAKVRSLPQTQDVVSDLRLSNPRLQIDIDRDKALAVGVTPEAIANTLFSAYGNRQVSTINTPSNEYYVILEVLPEYQTDPEKLSKLYVRSSSGKLIPLAAVTKMVAGVSPLSVNHVSQLPSVTISFNLRPGAALGDAVNAITAAADEIGLPSTTNLAFQGTAQAFQDSLKGLTILLIVAIVVIYLVLGVLYESYIHPVTILSGLPSAGLGALLTLQFFKMELNLYAFVGLILLIGIVKKNAIMMIDFAIEARNQEMAISAEEAIYQGCLLRFRPIMMTTMAALLGALPIAIGLGAGAEARRPLGLAVVGGLMVSQVLTLYLTPVVYIYLERVQTWLRRGKQKPVPAPAPGFAD